MFWIRLSESLLWSVIISIAKIGTSAVSRVWACAKSEAVEPGLAALLADGNELTPPLSLSTGSLTSAILKPSASLFFTIANVLDLEVMFVVLWLVVLQEKLNNILRIRQFCDLQRFGQIFTNVCVSGLFIFPCEVNVYKFASYFHTRLDLFIRTCGFLNILNNELNKLLLFVWSSLFKPPLTLEMSW